MLLAAVRPLARQAVHTPIETIVAAFVLATLAYFHVIHAIKHSAFLAPASTLPQRPSYALYTHDGWTGTPKGPWLAPAADMTRVEIQQVVVSGPLTNGTRWLAPDSTSPLASAFQTACYRDAQDQCITLHNPEGPVLVFNAGGREAFTGAFQRRPRIQEGSVVLTLETSQIKSLAEMGSGKWVAYAAQALVLRFWDLTKVRVPAYILHSLLTPASAEG
jgi:hydroxymethylglutaryl-CoA reductase (NADPH)